jgi:CheY-like chemotaxis protein
MNTERKFSSLPILIVEDRKENQVLLQTVCNRNGIKSFIASNGQDALDIASKVKISVYVVDIMLPVMDGKTFIQEIKKRDPDAVIIVQSALDLNQTIIEIMRLGVYDYIIKPIDIEYFSLILNKSLEFKYLKDLDKELSLNENIKLRGQLEWLNYKESLRITGKDSYQKNSIFNLTTSLSQGGGVGTTISLIDIIKDSTSVHDENHYLVDRETLDTLYVNNEFSRRIIFGLTEVVRLMEEQFTLTKISLQKFVSSLPEKLKDVIPVLKNKSMGISFPKFEHNQFALLDEAKFLLVVEELLINAYKYSLENTKIQLFANITGAYFCLSIKNETDDNSYGGIPQEKEKLVLEPFYRIHPPVEDVIEIEKFSLGLGLTVVDFIVNKHNGMFFIHNAIDHTTERKTNCVLAEVFLPILMNEDK